MRFLKFGGLALAAAFAPVTPAQDYPARPIRVIVPFPPAGAADLLARVVGQKLAEAFAQQVVVDNRPGAGGNIGPELAARAAPDGYTALLAASTTHAVSKGLYAKLAYDLERDLAPVGLIANIPHILVAHPSLPVRNVKELVALGKSRPGEINFASQGNGTLSHLEQELLKKMAGFTAQHVPYKGSGPGLADLLGGNVQLFFDSIPSSLPHVNSGRLRGLAVASSQRSPALPDLPTIGESLKGFEADSLFGLMVPAATPRAIITRLSTELRRIVALPDIRDRLLAQGGFTRVSTPEEMAASIQSDIAKWGIVIRESGAKIE